VAEEYLRLAQRLAEADHLVLAHRHMGYSLCVLGRFGDAREHSERALALYHPEAHRSMMYQIGFDLRASALVGLFYDLFALGYPEQAAARVEEALTWSDSLHHPHTRVIVLNLAAKLDIIRAAEEMAETLLDEAITLATAQRFPLWLAISRTMKGHLLSKRHGRRDEAVALARQGLAEQRATGSRVWQTYFLGLFAQTCDAAGRADEALSALRDALDMANRTGERLYEAELHRLKGEWIIAHRHEQREEAENCFQRALAVARSQEAKMWELRAAISLARLWRDYARGKEAHGLLGAVYDWFAEGFATPDLKEAETLLDELRNDAKAGS
jgi:predicted ATPase